MKTRIFLFMMLIVLPYCINADEINGNNFAFDFFIGNFGGGMHFFSGTYDFEITANIATFLIEHTRTNIGLILNPLKFRADYSIEKQEWNTNLFFLNGRLYWNPLNFNGIIFGPFASINYLSLENWSNFNTQNFIFSSGLMFNLWSTGGQFPFQIIGSEVGFRNISGRHGFYFNVNIDILALVVVIVLSLQAMGSDAIAANEGHGRQREGAGPFIPRDPTRP